MYVVHVVQAGAGLPLRQHPVRQQNRSVSTEAGNGPMVSHGVILQPAYDTPPQAAAASDALSCQPTRTAVVPWLRQIAVLMRSPERLPPSVSTRCSPQEGSSIGVLTATSPTSTSTSTTVAWGEGPDPLTIHLPGADGTAESSPADPASGGLPNTPTVVSSNSNSLALKQQAAVQRRQSGELGFRPGSGGSRTLPTMLQRGANSSNALQARPSATVPAAAPSGGSTSLQPKLPGPLGLLPALQWGGSGTFWGSPIGGTLFINPSLDEPAAVTPTQQQQHGHNQQQQLLTKSSGMQWGSPIGGTLFINPPVHELGASPASAWAPLEDTTAAAAATGATAARAAASNNTLPGVAKAGSRTSKLPFLPPFKWGGGASSKAQWGALPIGGTLYINPEAPADWHEGPWGSGSSGFGSSSGGGGGGSSNGSSGGSGGGIAGGVRSRQAGSGYVPAGAAQANWAVPSGLRLAKLGVGLMAAIAAAAMAVYLKATPSASTTTSSASRGNGAVEARSAAPAPSGGGAATAAAGSNGTAAGPADAAAEAAPAGVGFHQWMVQRLQSTLESFEAEQGLLKAELAALKGMAAAHSSQQGVLGGFRRWLGGSSKGGSPAGDASEVMSAAAATAAAVSGGVTSAGRVGSGPGGSGSSADVASRVAEVQEQLDSIAVLRAALAAELAEHQQMLRAAEQQQQASKERLAALAGR